jgi:hypothetical protein
MLINPFTPARIASQVDEFFGRAEELSDLEYSLHTGSVAIQGAVGIGKSSLLSRVRLSMEGFGTGRHGSTVIAVGNKDITTVDEAARLLMEEFLEVDEEQSKIKFIFPKIFEYESSSICRHYKEGRHLAAFNKILEARCLPDSEILLLAVDEADKCPVPLARLIRSVTTKVQHEGIDNIRFALAGVSPFFQKMVDEDEGISRFFYKTLTLQPMTPEETHDLVHTKLAKVAAYANENDLQLETDDEVVDRIVSLSGGHPHLVQLLGSHLIKHENQNPDGQLTKADLYNSLRTICYEDRARVYDSTVHFLDLESKLEPFKQILDLASAKCPTRIQRARAQEIAGTEILDWLVSRNILRVLSPDEYGLIDEFLRIRLFFDELAEEEAEAVHREKLLVQRGRFLDYEEELKPDFDIEELEEESMDGYMEEEDEDEEEE